MIASVRMSRMTVLSVNIMMIFFQKDSWMNQTLSLWKQLCLTDCFQPSAIQLIVIMRPASMKIPPLNQLYQQKISFQAHRRRINSIMRHSRSSSVQQTLKDSHHKRYQYNFERKNNSKSLEIARANNKILEKLKNAKPSLSSVKEYIKKSSQSRTCKSVYAKNKIVEQEKENYRIKNRVKTMSSSLSKDSMMRDYNISMQIKNRLSHFKTQPNNKVVLKANRYLGSSSISSKSQAHIINKPKLINPEPTAKTASSQQISKQFDDHKLNKELINQRMKRVGNNIASYYKKEEVLKNKIANTSKLFKMTRENRIKTISALEQHPPLPNTSQNHEDTIFPTAVAKSKK